MTRYRISFSENKFCYVVLPRRKHVDEVAKELAKKYNLKVESIEKA